MLQVKTLTRLIKTLKQFCQLPKADFRYFQIGLSKSPIWHLSLLILHLNIESKLPGILQPTPCCASWRRLRCAHGSAARRESARVRYQDRRQSFYAAVHLGRLLDALKKEPIILAFLRQVFRFRIHIADTQATTRLGPTTDIGTMQKHRLSRQIYEFRSAKQRVRLHRSLTLPIDGLNQCPDVADSVGATHPARVVAWDHR